MKTSTLFQVRFRPSVTPPRGFTKSAHYNVTDTRSNPSKERHEYLIGNTWLSATNFIKIEVEDAPVFQKPILRKIASLKPDEAIYCETDAEVKAIISQADKEGIYYMTTGVFKAPLYIKDKKAPSYSKQETDTILPASKFVEVGTEPEPITQAQKDECVKLQERIKELEEKLSQTEHVSELRNRMIGEMAVKNTKSQERIEELEALCELMLKDQEGLADEAESYREANAICISRIKRIENFAKAAIESNNDTLHKVALREIANGEI